MLKSPHRKGFPERIGKKLHFRGDGRFVDKLNNRTKKFICSEIVMKVVDNKRKSITVQKAESKLMKRHNRLS